MDKKSGYKVLKILKRDVLDNLEISRTIKELIRRSQSPYPLRQGGIKRGILTIIEHLPEI